MTRKLSKIESKRLQEIYKIFDLNRSNIFIGDDFFIFDKPGIQKIKNKIGAEIKFSLEYQYLNYVTIRGEGQAVIDGQSISIVNFGEASPANNEFPFPVAVALKRCESRIVLEMAGLYEKGFRGDVEFDGVPKKDSKLSKESSKTVKQTLAEIKIAKDK